MRSSSVSGLGVAVGEVESLHVKSHDDDGYGGSADCMYVCVCVCVCVCVFKLECENVCVVLIFVL